MKRSRFTEEQTISTLKQVEAGAKVQDVIRKLGVTEQTFYGGRPSSVAWRAVWAMRSWSKEQSPPPHRKPWDP